ncbi:MAG: hypothetical protein K0Q43_2271 [Ramlibacter sp.]|nr:hypothetical protein [Ramlibacter sp.]MDF2464036.1 hypothetical protein [Ramlibacter sp.]
MNASRINANAGLGDSVIPPVKGGPQDGFIGVLMLDTRFPRPPGDIGHPDCLGAPVRRAVVDGAWPSRVVASAESMRASGLAGLFGARARELEREGARAITTSCGFLVLLQRELQQAVSVPVVTSSLLHLPRLLAGGSRVGVLTISAAHLGREHLLAAGVEPARQGDVIVQGVDPDGEFAQAILGNRAAMDLAAARANVVSAALELKARAPDLGSVVLECTNMPPYAAAVREATGWQLYSLLDFFGRVT